MPKLSIITVNLNNAKGLQRTMDSVFQQTFTDYEYIIMDGGSTDGSKSLIENHANKLVYWVSKKDKGIYNAMNKGIAEAKGEYLLFLNSGDHLKESTILQELSASMDGTGIIYGNTFLIESETKSWIGHHPPELTFSFFVDGTLPQSASFIKRSVFDTVGSFDEDLIICSDWKFFLNAICRHNVSYKHEEKVISVFYLDGISSTGNSKAIIEKEKSSVLQKEYPIFLKMSDELAKYKKPQKQRLKKLLTRVKYRLRKYGIIKQV
jgi:glycosyltransferase involved in cell wall biosynthesis